MAAAAAMLVGGLAAPAPSKALTTSSQASMNIYAADGTLLARIFLRWLYDALVPDNRGARARAETDGGGPKDSTEVKGPWNGVAGPVQVESRDTFWPAYALATAENRLVGKSVQPTIARGNSAFAQAWLTWKGRKDYDYDEQESGEWGDEVPTPDDVERAELLLSWSLNDVAIDSESDGAGRLDVDLAIGGQTAFDGSASYSRGVDDGDVSFFGDLVAEASQFDDTSMAIRAGSLDLFGDLLLPVDYEAFHASRKVEVLVDGTLTTAVSGVPVPPTLALALCAFGLWAGLSRLRRPKPR